MGGWTVLYYLLKYPPTRSTIEVAASAAMPDKPPPSDSGKGYLSQERRRDEEKSRVQVAGAFVLCPMVEGRPEVMSTLLKSSLERVAPLHHCGIYRESAQVFRGQPTYRQSCAG